MGSMAVEVVRQRKAWARSSAELHIDEYLRERLMPVEGTIPHVHGIEMYGECQPAQTAGGDLFEYINFQHRYDVDARIESALKASRDILEDKPSRRSDCNGPSDYMQWLKARPDYRSEWEGAYKQVRSLEMAHVAENLSGLRDLAGILIVDAQGHGVISAKIASTVHDTFHALMLSELDHHGMTTPAFFENLNLRLAHSVSARNALGTLDDGAAREIATMVYGEVSSSGHFRFVNFGHPPPLLFSAATQRFRDLPAIQMVQLLPLGLDVPEDHPDRRRYTSLRSRPSSADCSDIADIAFIDPGDILFLYSDGLYDGSAEDERLELEDIIRVHSLRSAREISSAILDYAVRRDRIRISLGQADLVDDKTVVVVKRSSAS
ncbi:MAG TPA: PP2C family protein-serine/threonine phosphatase [Bryobacteraceae bacterium]|nr:PP2C family protein-serine/threonine phosphatase [Bryobacteraceae bacterium]